MLRRLAGGTGLAFAAGVAVLLLLPTLHRTLDDAWISFRYAANLVDGYGLVWNAAPPAVEGYSNLTWTLLAALGLATGAPLLPWMWTWALGLSVGVVLAAAACVRAAQGSPFAAVCAALLVATSAVLRPWLLTGLETPLFAFLLAAGTARLLVEVREPGRAPLSAVAFGLVAVTRPEGALYLLVPAVAWLRARPPGRRAFVVAALLAGPLLAQLAFRVVTYGAWVANTGVAKIAWGNDPVRVDGWRYLLAALTYDPLLTVFVAVGGALAIRRGAGLLLLPALPAAAFVLLANGDSFGELRLLAGAAPCVIAGAIVGVESWIRRRERRQLVFTAAFTLVVAATAATEAWVLRAERAAAPAGPPGSVSLARRLGPPWVSVRWRHEGGPGQRDLFRLPSASRAGVDWFARLLVERLPLGGTFVLEDIGLVGWMLRDARLLDGRGLTWPEAARVANLDVPPDTSLLDVPVVQAFHADFHREAPALVFLTCPAEGFPGPVERALLADPAFSTDWRLAARGPYFSGRGQVCLYERAGFEPAAPEVGVARYRRLEAELPGLQDWAGLRADLEAGKADDPAAPWRVGADGTTIGPGPEAAGRRAGRRGRGERPTDRLGGPGAGGRPPAGAGADATEGLPVGEAERRARRRARGLPE